MRRGTADRSPGQARLQLGHSAIYDLLRGYWPLTIKNNANLIGGLLKWIRTIADGTPITWAIEDGRGFARRLADGLLLAGHEVVWVPTRLMAAHRRRRPVQVHAPGPGRSSCSVELSAQKDVRLGEPSRTHL